MTTPSPHDFASIAPTVQLLSDRIDTANGGPVDLSDLGDFYDAGYDIDPSTIPDAQRQICADALASLGGSVAVILFCALWRNEVDHAGGTVTISASGLPEPMRVGAAILAMSVNDPAAMQHRKLAGPTVYHAGYP